MADNPHFIEKEIHGTFNTELLTGTTIGNFADRIVGLETDFPTGDRQNHALYDRLIKEYYRRLDTMGFTNLQTDLVDAGFSPKTITGFFDLAKNDLLFNFFGSGNAAYIYSMTKKNDLYTGYACRIRRSFDNAEVDVKFNSDGRVSGNSEVVLHDAALGTGIRVDGMHPVRDGVNYTGDAVNAGAVYSEDILSGFLNRPGGYLTRMGSLSEGQTDQHNNLYVTKWYSQGITGLDGNSPVHLTGTPVDERLNATAAGLTFSNQNYANQLLPSSNSESNTNGSYAISGTITGNFDGRVPTGFYESVGLPTLPVYTRTETFANMVLFPHNFGDTSPYGLRWVITRKSFGTAVTDFNNSIVTTELNAYSNSNITPEQGYRPSDYTSWTVKLDQNTNFDTSVTFNWSRHQLEACPVIAASGTLLTDSNGNIPVRFAPDNNPCMLGTQSSIDLNTGTISSVTKLNNTGQSIGMIWQIGTGDNNMIINSNNNKSAYLGYGQIFNDGAFTYHTRMSGTLNVNANRQLFGSDSMFATGGPALADSVLEQVGSKPVHVIVHDTPTGDIFIFNGTGTNAANDFGSGEFGKGRLHVGCDAGISGGANSFFNGDIYEILAFDNDPKDTAVETAKYTGAIATQYGINI